MNRYVRLASIMAATVAFSAYAPSQKIEEPKSCTTLNETYSAFQHEIMNVIEHGLNPILKEHAEKNLPMDSLVAKVKATHIQADKLYEAYVVGIAACLDDTVKIKVKSKPQNGF